MHNQFSFYYPDGTFFESRDAKELFFNLYTLWEINFLPERYFV